MLNDLRAERTHEQLAQLGYLSSPSSKCAQRPGASGDCYLTKPSQEVLCPGEKSV